MYLKAGSSNSWTCAHITNKFKQLSLEPALSI